MIPPFERATGNLPAGEHVATWEEISERFGHTQWRRQLLAGLEIALVSLRAAGCKMVYLDGSFVTAKVQPGDFDACWDAEGVRGDLLDWELRTEEGFENGRAAQKRKYRGELFPANVGADGLGTPFREFFQHDKDGNPKGIIVIILKGLP
jgi:hypothetical protein